MSGYNQVLQPSVVGSCRPFVENVAHGAGHVVAGAGLETTGGKEVFGVDFPAGRIGVVVRVGGVGVFHVEIGAAGGATVENEQQVGVDAENGGADVGPFHLGDGAVALTGGVSSGHSRLVVESEGDVLLLHQLKVRRRGLSQMRTSILIQDRSVKFSRSGLRPLRIGRMFVAAKDQLAPLVQASVSMVIHNQKRLVIRPFAKLRQFGRDSF